MLHFGEVSFEPVEKKDHVSNLVKFGNEGGLHKLRLTKKKTCILEQELNADKVHEQDNYILFIVCGPNSKSRIGLCEIYDIDWIHRSCKLHFWLSDRAEMVPIYGKESLNIATSYIFNTLGLNKISSDIVSEDVVMIDLFKKHKFLQEVRKRNHLFYRGGYQTVIEMGLLNKEFEVII